MPATIGLYIDIDRCYGCGTCEVACTLEKSLPPGRSHIHVTEIRNEPGAAPSRGFVPILCQHCDNPDCVEACSTGALQRNETGLIDFDADACIACGLCEEACGYGAINLDSATNQPERCDLCADRQQSGLLPACAQHCPGRAIHVCLPPGLSVPWDDSSAGAGKRGPKMEWSGGRVVYLRR